MIPGLKSYKVTFNPPEALPVSMWVVARDAESAHKAALMILTKAPYVVAER